MPYYEYGLFDKGKAPTFVIQATGFGVREIGRPFMASEDGYIIGVQHFRSNTEPSPHVGRIWNTNANQMLASVSYPTITSGTAWGQVSGGSEWRTARFASPLFIAKNTLYTATVSVNTVITRDIGSFSGQPALTVLTNGNLSGVTTLGVYSTTSGILPTLTRLQSRDDLYYVDVIYVPGQSLATVSGIPLEGQVLTATITDGIGAITNLSYQWQSSGNGVSWENITGATSATLLLTNVHVGRTIRIRGSYTDIYGRSVTTDSASTVSIINLNVHGIVTIARPLNVLGNPIQGETLIATVTDSDGLSGVSISYQWQSSDDGINWNFIPNAIGQTLLLTYFQQNKYVRVSAKYTDQQGTSEYVDSAPTGLIVNTNDLGTVTIQGSPIQNTFLTAVTLDVDGTAYSSIAYQWQSSTNGTTWVNISGATSNNIQLTSSLVGLIVRVNARYTDDFGATENIFSQPSSTVYNINDIGTIAVTGIVARGNTLTATVTDIDGLPGTISYQWQSSLGGTNWSNIVGATDSTLTLINSLVGRQIRVTASYTDSFGASESLTSTATSSITSPNIAGSIIIAGSTSRGQTLTAVVTDADGITGAITYRWQSSTNNGISWNDIAGQTDRTIELTSLLIGRQIRAIASYTDSFGANENLTSTATDVIADIDITGKIAITGNLIKGELLTATVIEGNNVNGEINYQWMAKSIDGNWNSIISENTPTLLLTRSLVGKRIRVLADYVDGLGISEYVISAETESVTNINTQGVATIAGFPIAGGMLRAVVTDDDGLLNIPISYQWQSSIDGETWEDISEETSQAIFLLPEVIEKQIRVLAEYIDELGTEESLYSTPTDAVIPSTEDGILKITGEPRQYKVLTAIIEDLNGVNESTVTYQWQKSFDNIEWADIAEATSNELYLKAAYQNHFIKVTSTYQTSLGNLVELTSDRTKLITSPFSSLNFVDSVNPYSQSSSINAVFTLESFPDWIVDTETGNLVPNSDGNNVIICTATVQQKKDPNLVVQSGVDYNRIYFEGYLVNPKVLLNVEQGRNVTAVINGRQGIFDFVPIMESGQEITLKQREVNGQRIAGYFRLGSLINAQ